MTVQRQILGLVVLHNVFNRTCLNVADISNGNVEIIQWQFIMSSEKVTVQSRHASFMVPFVLLLHIEFYRKQSVKHSMNYDLKCMRKP